MKQKMTPDKWMKLVDDQKRSGLSAAEFARQNKLNPSTFQYWCKKVKDSSNGNVKLVKVSPKLKVVAEPTLLMINNFKIEIPADISSMKIAKIISVIRENI